MAIQKRAIKQNVNEVLFVMQYKVVITNKTVDVTLMCDHSNEGCCTVLFVVLFVMLYKLSLWMKS